MTKTKLSIKHWYWVILLVLRESKFQVNINVLKFITNSLFWNSLVNWDFDMDTGDIIDHIYTVYIHTGVYLYPYIIPSCVSNSVKIITTYIYTEHIVYNNSNLLWPEDQSGKRLHECFSCKQSSALLWVAPLATYGTHATPTNCLL